MAPHHSTNSISYSHCVYSLSFTQEPSTTCVSQQSCYYSHAFVWPSFGVHWYSLVHSFLPHWYSSIINIWILPCVDIHWFICICIHFITDVLGIRRETYSYFSSKLVGDKNKMFSPSLSSFGYCEWVAFYILFCHTFGSSLSTAIWVQQKAMRSLWMCLSNPVGCFVRDSIAHYMVPALIIIIFSVTLFARVTHHKYHIRQRIDWRNYRKMSLQLLSISLVYMVLEAPPMILNAAYLSGLSWDAAADYYRDMLDLSLWVILFTPFASATSLPDLKAKCRNLILFWRRRRVIRPETITMNHRRLGQTFTVARTGH